MEKWDDNSKDLSFIYKKLSTETLTGGWGQRINSSYVFSGVATPKSWKYEAKLWEFFMVLMDGSKLDSGTTKDLNILF